MITHNLANMPLLGPVGAICRSFFDRNVPFIIVFSGPGVAPINKMQEVFFFGGHDAHGVRDGK